MRLPYNPNNVPTINIVKEHRNIWKRFLEKMNFMNILNYDLDIFGLSTVNVLLMLQEKNLFLPWVLRDTTTRGQNWRPEVKQTDLMMRVPLLNASHDQGPGFFERGDDCEDEWWRHNDPMADGRLAEERNERKKKIHIIGFQPIHMLMYTQYTMSFFVGIIQ